MLRPPILATVFLLSILSPAAAEPLSADVAVLGATPGGIAAAVAAARLGSSVVLLEPTRHVGGIVASGLTNADIHNRKAVAGLFHEFTRRVVDHYRTTYGPQSPQLKTCQNGHFFEPHVAEKIFLAMLAGQEGRIRLLTGVRLLRAERDGDSVTSVVVEDDSGKGQPLVVRARIFVDASYEGDLAAAAGAEYRVGRESRGEYGEPHAGRIYIQFGKTDPLPGTTGQADRGIQAYCFRISVTRKPENRVPIARPAAYDPHDYDHLAADIQAGRVKKVRDAIQLWPMPNDKFEINSDHMTSAELGPSESLDLAEEIWDYPEAGPRRRREMFRRCWDYDEGLLWFLGHDPRVPKAIRAEMQSYGYCRDEFTDNRNRPWQMYVREARRIVGRYMFSENEGQILELGRTRIQPSSVGIAEFPWDSHAVHKYDPTHPGVREGYFFVRHPPAQIPYEVLLPRAVRRLLVPVCCSATHVGYQSIRMEPVFMALGQAAGTAAHLAIRGRMELDRVPAEELQIALVEQGAVVTHFEDVPFEHPAFAALQFLGSRGLNGGYEATPELRLKRSWGATKLQRILYRLHIRWSPPEDRPDDPLRPSDLRSWLTQINWPAGPAADDDQPLTVAQFAEIVYESYKNHHPR